MKTTDAAPIYSTFADDPDLGEIVEMFASEMPERVAQIERLTAEPHWSELQRVAHQLKGAAGSYGFDVLTYAAAHLEKCLRDGQPSTVVLLAVEDLLDLCRRVRPGVPSVA